MGGSHAQVGVEEGVWQVKKSIDVIGYAWPAEFAVILLYGLVAIWVMPTERVELFFRFLPIIATLVGLQSAAVYFGKAQGVKS